eukprot:g71029.t1
MDAASQDSGDTGADEGSKPSSGDEGKTLCFTSPNFDALKALSAPEVQPPLQVAPLARFHWTRELLPSYHPEYK